MIHNRTNKVREHWVAGWPVSEQPRGRLLEAGPRSVTDAELLAILLRTGIKGTSVLNLCKQLLTRFGGLRGLLNANPQDLLAIPGIGPVKLATLLAAGTLATRIANEQLRSSPFIGHSRDVRDQLSQRMRDRDRETFTVLFLNTRHCIIAIEDLFTGTVDTATVHPREIVRRALQHNSRAIVAAHNHPSGNCSPSNDDRQVTREIMAACKVLDITLLDHIVFGANSHFSFAEHQLL